MEEINQEKFEKAKAQALLIFQKNKKIKSPLFGEIRITPDGFDHIEWKSRWHKRPMNEAFVRYICFNHVVFLLNKSALYQEYREKMEIVRINKTVKQNKIVHYYGFVAIVNDWKNRVKVVIRKVDGWNNYEFVSIIPAWINKWYTNITFFDADDRDIEASTKKVIDDDDCFSEAWPNQ